MSEVHGGRVKMFSLTMTPRMRKASVAIRCTSKLKRRLDASSFQKEPRWPRGSCNLCRLHIDAANNNSINSEISKICIDSFIETVFYHFYSVLINS